MDPDNFEGVDAHSVRRGRSVRRPGLKVIGWREWVSLVELDEAAIKAKIDTGARTSSLHAYDLEEYQVGGRSWMRFKVHPVQRSSKVTVQGKARLLERRKVTASSGHSELRPVVVTTIEILGERWPVELTLTRRDEMGFRMLLGRQAMRGRFLVDPSKSFLNGRRTRKAHTKRRKGKDPR